MEDNKVVASLILAAGKGSRMKGFEGNKTLLPLVPGGTPFEGDYPILLKIIDNLPPGPKALVVNYKKEDIIKTTKDLKLTYCEQPEINGTGGAILASDNFIKNTEYDYMLVTMGDIPLVEASTFLSLINELENSNLAVLGFYPRDKKKYGVLDIDNRRVKKIIEWEYWNKYSKAEQDRLSICNAGIYAIRKKDFLKYLDLLSRNPHMVIKERDGKKVEIEEYFITDMIQWMHEDGLDVGYHIAENEYEVMGVDDVDSLITAQNIFKKHKVSGLES